HPTFLCHSSTIGVLNSNGSRLGGLRLRLHGSRLPTDERHSELLEKRVGLLVGLGRGDERHVHAVDSIDLVNVDFREDDLLPDTERVVASPVEASIGYAAE